MATPRPPEPAFLIIGILASPEVDVIDVRATVEKTFSPVADALAFRPFTESRYYEREMGEGVLRGFWRLSEKVPQDALAAIKLCTNELEARWARGGARRVNLDPGILDLGKFALASCKPAAHRVVLGGGVACEIEYLFQGGTFVPLPWTYPDYLAPAAVAWFNAQREAYRLLRKAESAS